MLVRILLSIVILCSIFACEKVKLSKVNTEIRTAPGPEDIVYDPAHNRILVSCNERRSGMPLIGVIYQIDVATNESTLLPLVNMPDIPFNPHGFDLQTVDGVSCLYVINHYRDDFNTSSVVQFAINAENLEFVREYKDALLISPNDLTVLPDGSFYFSNDRNSADVIELLTNPKGGSLGYCNGATAWKKVDSLIAFPNGLYNENNVLYLATSRNNALYTYTINGDGSLQNKNVLSGINGMDNISIHGDELIIAVHPDEVKFALLSFDPATISPSRTYSIHKNTGIAKPIFNDDGQIISGSSTAVVVGNDLYLAQVFGEFVLKVENYQE